MDLLSNAGIGKDWAISLLKHQVGDLLTERDEEVEAAAKLDYATLMAEDTREKAARKATMKAAKAKRKETGSADVERKSRRSSGRGHGSARPRQEATKKLLPNESSDSCSSSTEASCEEHWQDILNKLKGAGGNWPSPARGGPRPNILKTLRPPRSTPAPPPPPPPPGPILPLRRGRRRDGPHDDQIVGVYGNATLSRVKKGGSIVGYHIACRQR